MPKISELASGAPVVSTDALIIQRGGANYSVTIDNLQALYPQKSEDATITGDWVFQGDDGYTYVSIADPSVDPAVNPNIYFYTIGPRINFFDMTAERVAAGAYNYASNRISMWTYDSVGSSFQQNIFDGTAAAGTYASPSQPASGVNLFKLRASSYVTDGFYECASLDFDAGSTDTGEGRYARLSYSAWNGSSLRARFSVEEDGGFVTYLNGVAATGGSKGDGTINAKGLYVDGVPANLPPTVVASLPTAVAGARGFVTDSNATLAAGHGNIVAGGGANFVPVYSDGTNWRIG